MLLEIELLKRKKAKTNKQQKQNKIKKQKQKNQNCIKSGLSQFLLLQQKTQYVALMAIFITFLIL